MMSEELCQTQPMLQQDSIDSLLVLKDTYT